MTRRLTLLAIVLAGWFVAPSSALAQFIRGDANGDSTINIADPIFTLSYLYSGGTVPANFDAGDVNDNGLIEITDCAYLLLTLFSGGPVPPFPFPGPGIDSTPPNFPTAPTGDLEFRLSDGVGCGGSQALVSLHITNQVPIEAINVRITFDPAELGFLFTDETPMEVFLGDSPDFYTENIGNGSLIIGTLFSLISPTLNGLQPQTDGRMVDIVFNVDPGVAMGVVVDVELTDDPTAAIPSFNLGSAQGEVILADTTNGTITMTCVGIEYLRGDNNEDSTVSISDAVHLINFLFLGGPASGCERTGDTNADNSLDVADVVYLLNALFNNGPSIPGPFPICAIDTAVSGVSCNLYNGNCP